MSNLRSSSCPHGAVFGNELFQRILVSEIDQYTLSETHKSTPLKEVCLSIQKTFEIPEKIEPVQFCS